MPTKFRYHMKHDATVTSQLGEGMKKINHVLRLTIEPGDLGVCSAFKRTFQFEMFFGNALC